MEIIDSFLNQTFSINDIPKIFTLGFLELLLSADNAIIIALLVRRLASTNRLKALIIGITSAFIFRAIGLLFISVLIQNFWIEILGAGYLFYLSFKYFFQKKRFEPPDIKPSKMHFWKIILRIEIIDLAFALDAIISALAFIVPYEASGEINPKLWLVYLGGMIGLIGVRFASEFFARLIDSFPKIEDSAHLMLTWIGLRILIDGISKLLKVDINQYPYIQPIFWIGIAVFFFLGLIGRKKKSKR